MNPRRKDHNGGYRIGFPRLNATFLKSTMRLSMSGTKPISFLDGLTVESLAQQEVIQELGFSAWRGNLHVEGSTVQHITTNIQATLNTSRNNSMAPRDSQYNSTEIATPQQRR